MKEKIITFFTDVIKEMKKVTWPQKDELRDATLVVLVICGVITVFVFGVDQLLNQILQAIM